MKKTKEYPWTDKAANKISSALLFMQTKTSDAVNKRMAGISGKSMKMILIVFCLSWGGLSGYYLINALFNKSQPAIKVNFIHIPQPVNRAGVDETENRVGEEIYQQMKGYKNYMDSTQQTIRAGLLDSMKVLEQIYLSQKKENEKK